MDEYFVFVRRLWKTRKYVFSNNNQNVTIPTVPAQKGAIDGKRSAALVYDAGGPPFGASIDVKRFVFRTEIDKKIL